MRRQQLTPKQQSSVARQPQRATAPAKLATHLQLQAELGHQPVNQSLHPQQSSDLPKPLFRGLSQALGAELSSSGSLVQAKLTVGQADDRYEQEADQVAKQVMRQVHAPVGSSTEAGQSPQVQAENHSVQRQSDMSGTTVAPNVEASIQQARGGGQSLPHSLRDKFEPAMGADFSQVRVHTDGDSDQLNRMVQARAFTTGQDVFFRQGAYDPGSHRGQELIAHELTHVMQQNREVTQHQAASNRPISTGMGQKNSIQRVIGGVGASLQFDPVLYIQKLMKDDKKPIKDRYEQALDTANEHYENTGNVKFARLAAECAVQLKQYSLAAKFYKAAYKQERQPDDALKAARNYKEAKDLRKADIWYRVVRRGHWENRGEGKYGALPTAEGIKRVDHAIPATPAMVEEANRHLGRLGYGETFKYQEFLKLEDRMFTDRRGQVRSLYEGDQKYKKEEKPAPGGKTIAAGLVDAWDDDITQGRLTNAGLQQKLRDLDIDRNQMGSYIVRYNRSNPERAALELKPGNGGITQGTPPTLFSTNNMHSVASGAKYAIFAMSRSGRIYATNHRISRVHHTSPLAGGDVAAAGEMVVQNGVLLCITNKSGHYAPNERHLVQVLQEVQSRFKVNLATVQLKFFDASKSVFWPGGAAQFLQDVQRGTFANQLQQLQQAKGNGPDPNPWSPP